MAFRQHIGWPWQALNDKEELLRIWKRIGLHLNVISAIIRLETQGTLRPALSKQSIPHRGHTFMNVMTDASYICKPDVRP